MLERLELGVPPELIATAYGLTHEQMKTDPEILKAMAEGEILLFERARDSGVTGIVRAAMRREANSWLPQAEPNDGKSLEDLLRG